MKMIEKVGIDIRRHYAAGGSTLSRQPVGDRASAGARLHALPALGDAERLDAAAGGRVKALFQERQALASVLPCIVERVRHQSHSRRPARNAGPSCIAALSQPCGDIASTRVQASATTGIATSDCGLKVNPGASSIPTTTATTDAMKTPMEPSMVLVVLTGLRVGTM